MPSQMPKITPRDITSLDVVSMDGGLDERGDYNAAPNTFIYGRNVMPDMRGLLTHRYTLKRWLPDTVQTVYQVFGSSYNGTLYYFTADNSKIRYTTDGATTWTDCGGSNSFTTGVGVKTIFMRVLNKIFVINGHDKVAYVDLTTMNVVKYTPITDPANAPNVTATGSGVTVGSGNFKIYYALSFNSSIGETKISPIQTATITKDRYTWKADGTDWLDIAFNNTPPTGAKSINLYMATKAIGGSPAATDLLPLALGLDITTTTFRDNGNLPLNLSAGTAPQDNSTDGPTCQYATESGGRPILYGDVINPSNIWIGGDGDNADDFSPNNGGYRLEVSKGTNYYPTSITGFRNGQGIPSLTILFSNPNGLSRQAIMEQQTVTYSNISFVVWTEIEQNYGAAGVAAPFGVTNYLGGLYFPSTDGFVKMDTSTTRLNVLSVSRITDAIYQTVSSIKDTAQQNIVVAAWDNKIIWSVPSRGYDFNNELVVYDLKNTNAPIWYKWDIRAQWVGTISPANAPSFIYVCQDNHVFRLTKGYVAADENSNGVLVPFATEARGGWTGLNPVHNEYKAVVQVVFDVVDGIGTLNSTVSYLNRGKTQQTQTKPITFANYTSSSADGWDNPGYNYDGGSKYLQWDGTVPLSGSAVGTKSRQRGKIRLKSITNEVQWSVSTDASSIAAFILRGVSFEGVNIGTKVDLR